MNIYEHAYVFVSLSRSFSSFAYSNANPVLLLISIVRLKLSIFLENIMHIDEIKNSW